MPGYFGSAYTGAGSNMSRFTSSLDDLFNYKDDDMYPKEIAFDTMESYEKNGKVVKSTPIARVLDTGAVYQLDKDKPGWVLYRKPKRITK